VDLLQCTPGLLDSWTAVEGGIDRITVGMTRTFTKQPVMNKWVNGIVGNLDQTVTAVISDDEKRTYSHVINTVPLSVMQNVEVSTLKLDYNKTFAIRKLQFNPSGKIGMSFKSRWYVPLYLS
jgi:protoporphyrinogen oxidase